MLYLSFASQLLFLIAGVCLANIPLSASAQGEKAEQTVRDEAAASPEPLPKILKGRWSNPSTGHSDIVEIEVLEMTTPRDGKALVTFWPYCRKTETPIVFERKSKVWRFTVSQCSGNADAIHMRVRPVEGKNRLEGWYGREGDGRSVYLEWK